MNKNEIAQMIDHTNLHAYANHEDMQKLCKEAIENNFKMVAINSVQTAICKEYLKGTNVHVGAAISFPLGQTTLEVKLKETANAIENGADEIDYVVNLTEVKEKNFNYKLSEIAKKVKPDFIKTSTGFGTGGATVEDVKLMKSIVGDDVKVKAAGGIRDLKTFLAMVDAGAERIGTSSGIKIINEFES